MSDGERSRLYNLDPVLLEYHPDGDFWTVHREEEASPEKKRSGQLVPFGTAIRLTNVRRCTSCFNVGTVTRKQ